MMTRKSRTEITIETERMLIVRHSKHLAKAFCLECDGAITMVTPEEASALTGIATRAIYRLVEAGVTHFEETPGGSLLVCLNSLSQETRHAPATPAPFAPQAAMYVECSFAPGGQRGVEQTTIDACPPLTASQPSYRRQSGWVLTAEALDKLLIWLDADRERAAQKYEKIRRKLLKYFECRGCLSPEDCADETMNRVMRCVCEGRDIWVADPANYFYGVARNVLREYWDAPERKSSPIESLSPLAHPNIAEVDLNDTESEQAVRERLLEALEQCIDELSPENREMIICYYQGEKGDRIKNRQAIARRMGIQANALRIRAHRLREKLEEAVEQRLKQWPAT